MRAQGIHPYVAKEALSYTHSLRVVYEGVGLVVAEADVDQVLHPILPLLPSVALEISQERFT